MALGALDVNKHLNSPHASPRKSPSKKSTFVFDDASERPVTYSLKEQVLEASLPPSRLTSPLRVSSASPSRNEKRKIASTSLLGDAEEALRHAKHARVEERERTAVGHGHMLGKDVEREVVGAADLIRQRDADEDAQVSYAVLVALGQRAYKTYQSSQETAPPRSPNTQFHTSVGQDDSQLTNITEPDVGPQTPGVPSPTVSELREVSTGRSNPSWENYYSRDIQNATALRLRLQFAMYKVKTNQLDIPLSRLELLSPTPALPSVASPSKLADDELPNTQPSAPSPSEDATPQALALSVPATATASPSKSDVDMAMATATRPMQAPMAESEPCEDLASSVVKGCAADGLLSLMASIQPQ
jgi:hypothetical protein